MKLGTTKISWMAGSRKKKRASRRLGSSFQKQQATSAKTPRPRMAEACARVGVLEAGFTVEPWPTMRRARDKLGSTKKTSNTLRRTSNPELKTATDKLLLHSTLGVGRSALDV